MPKNKENQQLVEQILKLATFPFSREGEDGKVLTNQERLGRYHETCNIIREKAQELTSRL